MPIYEYECDACEHRFEVLVRDRTAKSACPECASDKLNRLISTCAFALKGGGWYADGYSSARGGKDEPVG